MAASRWPRCRTRSRLAAQEQAKRPSGTRLLYKNQRNGIAWRRDQQTIHSQWPAKRRITFVLVPTPPNAGSFARWTGDHKRSTTSDHLLEIQVLGALLSTSSSQSEGSKGSYYRFGWKANGLPFWQSLPNGITELREACHGSFTAQARPSHYSKII